MVNFDLLDDFLWLVRPWLKSVVIRYWFRPFSALGISGTVTGTLHCGPLTAVIGIIEGVNPYIS